MANTGVKGINVRQTGAAIVIRASLKDSTGANITSGTTNLRLYELQSDGTLSSYDWATNTFKTTALTTENQSMSHRTGNNGTTNTGVWTYAVSTLTGFTNGAIYIAKIVNSGASPTEQEHVFQYGSAEGDLVVTANGTGVGELNADVKFWNGTAPNNLISGRVDTSVGIVANNAITLQSFTMASDGTNAATLMGAETINVTGATGSPNLNGVYYPFGINSSKPAYKSGTGIGLWYNGSAWILGGTIGSAGSNYYSSSGDETGYGGSWTANGTVTGTPTVTRTLYPSSGRSPTLIIVNSSDGSIYADMRKVLGTAVTATTAGIPDVNVKNYNNQAALTDVNNLPKVDIEDIRGTASAGVAGYVGLDWSKVQNVSATQPLSNTTVNAVTTTTNLTNAPTSGDFTAAMKTSLNAATPASVTGSVGSVTGNVGGSVNSVATGVTVTTNNDKTGYSLSVAPPTSSQIATAIWTDLLTSTDFSTASSVGNLIKTYVDAAISSRSTYAGGDTAGTGTLLARLTATRAGLLDNLSNLDAAISSRSTYGGADTSGTTTLLARLTSTRSTLLDNLNYLDSAISGVLSAVQNVQNNTFIASSIPSLIERPDSGSVSISLSFVFSDETGAAKNLDSGNPALVLVNDAGTSLSSRVGAWSNPATGKYTLTYTSSAADTIEGLHWEITGTINGKLRRNVWYTQIVDTTAQWFTSSDRTTLNSISTAVSALPTASTIAATVWSVLTSSISTVNSIGVALINFLAGYTAPPTTNDIATALFVDGPANKLKVNPDHTASAIIPASGGANAVTVHITDGPNSLVNATVTAWSNSIVAAVATSDVSGNAVLYLDSGIYSITVSLSGYNGNGGSITVSAPTSVSYTLTKTSITVSTPPTLTGYLVALNSSGNAQAGVTFSLQQVDTPGGAGYGYDQTVRTVTTGSDGLAQFTGLTEGAWYRIRRETGEWVTFELLEIGTSGTVALQDCMNSVLV